jgi:hypothetical protein
MAALKATLVSSAVVAVIGSGFKQGRDFGA